MKLTNVSRLSLGGAALLLSISAQASLSNSFQFNGNGNWSLDACGSNSTPVCDISAVVPLGSTIEKAFLYSSSIPGNTAVPTINLDGQIYSGTDWAFLGVNTSGLNLRAWRADVTAQVSATVGGGSATPFSFSVLSETPNDDIDGEVLAIIYSNPSESERTIAFLDGFSDSNGDTTSINLADPLTAAQLADPGFEAIMSLGIGYGFQGDGQNSIVDVNGTNLTTCAGGQDDGGSFNGALITVGGLGDSTNGPDCQLIGPRQDDELYSLVPFLTAGDTQIVIDTRNPSQDDNIFFAGFNITARGGVNQPPPPPTVPTSEPGILGLLGLGLIGLPLARRRRRNS